MSTLQGQCSGIFHLGKKTTHVRQEIRGKGQDGRQTPEGLRVQIHPVQREHLALWLLPGALLDWAKHPYLLHCNLPDQRPEEVQRV